MWPFTVLFIAVGAVKIRVEAGEEERGGERKAIRFDKAMAAMALALSHGPHRRVMHPSWKNPGRHRNQTVLFWASVRGEWVVCLVQVTVFA